MAKATERRCGGLLHFLKNGENETKLGQKNVFAIEMLKTLAEKKYKTFTFTVKMTKRVKSMVTNSLLEE